MLSRGLFGTHIPLCQLSRTNIWKPLYLSNNNDMAIMAACLTKRPQQRVCRRSCEVVFLVHGRATNPWPKRETGAHGTLYLRLEEYRKSLNNNLIILHNIQIFIMNGFNIVKQPHVAPPRRSTKTFSVRTVTK